jgi:hypothetical protein
MKSFKILFFAAILATAVGCSSSGLRTQQTPLPRSTPFDANQFARTAFLDGFEKGYRTEMAGGPASVESLSGPYLDIQKQGFHAGVTEARVKKTGEGTLKTR